MDAVTGTHIITWIIGISTAGVAVLITAALFSMGRQNHRKN